MNLDEVYPMAVADFELFFRDICRIKNCKAVKCIIEKDADEEIVIDILVSYEVQEAYTHVDHGDTTINKLIRGMRSSAEEFFEQFKKQFLDKNRLILIGGRTILHTIV